MPLFPVHRLPGLFACLLSATLVACGGGGSEVEPIAAPLTSPSSEIAVLRLAGNFYGDWPVQSYVARTESEWSRIWDLHDPMQSPAPERPVVDFSAYTVAGVSLGWAPFGCDWLEIFRITDEPEQVRVEYRRVDASPLTACTANLVPLVAFVKIPATIKPIVFEQAGR